MSISWPPLPGQTVAPVWNGQEFVIGAERSKVLCYHETKSGWNHPLTLLHEEAAGEHHYIDRASRQNAVDALAPVLRRRNPVILEVGCSSGFFLEDLRRKTSEACLIGSDFISEPLYRLAERLPGTPIVQFDLTKCPLDDDSVDAVVMLNVLEHIQDDREALRQVHRILRPGGLAFIEVPAGPHLYDFYDKHLMHFRRYRLEDLKSLAQETGFSVQRASHLGAFLYPVFSLVKKRNRRRETNLTETEREALVSGQIAHGSSSPFLHAVMKLELTLGKHFRYTRGIRCLVTLTK